MQVVGHGEQENKCSILFVEAPYSHCSSDRSFTTHLAKMLLQQPTRVPFSECSLSPGRYSAVVIKSTGLSHLASDANQGCGVC